MAKEILVAEKAKLLLKDTEMLQLITKQRELSESTSKAKGNEDWVEPD